MPKLTFHPLVELFPRMEDSAFAAFVADIREHGVRQPITVHEGQILDGRNRVLACEQLGIECPTREYEGNVDEMLGFVVSANLHRRQLSESQLALVAARIANFGHGGDRRSDQAACSPLVSQADAGKRVGVSERSVRDAVKVLNEAAPEMVKAVDTGVLPVSAAAKLVDKAPDFQRRVVKKIMTGTAKSAVDAVRLLKREDMADAPPLPLGQYRVVYGDPPWDYGGGGLQKYGHAAFHYPCMTIEELCELDIADRAGDDSVLFLWVTAPLLKNGFRLAEAWGFEYKTNFVWFKKKHNYGHYSSVRHEHLLVCTRGSCLPDDSKLYNSVQAIERSKHSAKPEEFRKIIDAMYRPAEGRNDRIELFPRERPPKHWDFWSNEVKAA